MNILRRCLLSVVLLAALTTLTIAQTDDVTLPDDMALTHFVLLDAANNVPLFQITEGSVIDLSMLPMPADQLNIQAVEAEGATGIRSVRFGINRNSNVNVENISPYTLYRNDGLNYFNGQLEAGDYVLTATPYSKRNAQGIAGTPLTVRFRAIDAPSVTGFTLVNAVDNTDILTLVDGMTIDFANLPVLNSQINIRADVDPPTVGSVMFSLVGPVTRTWRENFVPYSLFGDIEGNYNSGTLLSGDYMLTATPFTGLDGQGRANVPLTINFSVVTAPPDAAPFVVATTPTNGAENIPLTSSITLQFSEPVSLAQPFENDPIGLDLPMGRPSSNAFQLVCSLSGTRSLNAFNVMTIDQVTYTLQPMFGFQRGDACTGTVFAEGVTDLDPIDPPDNMLADFTFSFTAGDPPDAAPFVISTTPADETADVSLSPEIVITFSEAVVPSGSWFVLDCAISGVRDNLNFLTTTNDAITYTLQSFLNLSNDETCTGTIFATGITDLDNDDPPDNMPADFSFSFATMPPPDAAPIVSSTSLPDGATEVPTDTTIGITFTEPVAVTGNWFTLLCTVSGERDITAFTVETIDNITYTLTPLMLLAQDDSCLGTVFGAGVNDLDLNDPPDFMQENFVFGFTTQSTDAAPSVTFTDPANNTAEVGVNSVVRVGFSEAVNTNGEWFTLVCDLSGTRGVAGFAITTPDNIIYTLTPLATFAEGETCIATVSAEAISDVDANDPPDTMLADFSFTFITETPPDTAPFVQSTTPGAGATGVSLTSPVTFTFSEPVNVTGDWVGMNCTFSGARFGSDGVIITTEDNITFTVTSIQPFVNGEVCTVGVAAALVTDQDTDDPPDNMQADFIYTFTTVFDAAPAVFNTFPADGGVNVFPGADVLIAFTEPVNAPAAAFSITCASGARAFALTTTDNIVFTLNPTTNFGLLDTCTVRINAALVTDLDANDPFDNMASDVTFTFTTRAE